MENQNPAEQDLNNPEEEGQLNEEELEEVSGGIIIVGGKSFGSSSQHQTPLHTDWSSLNPQPIPPGKNPGRGF